MKCFFFFYEDNLDLMIMVAARTASSDTQVVVSITVARARKDTSVLHSLPQERNGSTAREKVSVQSSVEEDLGGRLRMAQEAAHVGDGSPSVGDEMGQLIGDGCSNSRTNCLLRAYVNRSNFSLKLALSSVFCSNMSSCSLCRASLRLWIPLASHLPKVLQTSRSMYPRYTFSRSWSSKTRPAKLLRIRGCSSLLTRPKRFAISFIIFIISQNS